MIMPPLARLQVGHLDIDLNSYRLLRDGQPVRLTPTEWALLRELVHHPNQVLSHRTLLQRVWGDEYTVEFDYVHTYISRLRRKLESDPSNPDLILTEAGIGYLFNHDSPTDAQNSDEISTHTAQTTHPTQTHVINPLPQKVGKRYVGRQDQREQLRALLLDETRLISIYGRAGVGKTALASKVLGDLIEEGFFDGMVLLSATSTGITLTRILADFATLLNNPGLDPASQPTVYRVTHLLDALKNGKYVLLLDNLEHLQDPHTNELKDEEIGTFFRVALEQGSTLRILLTSRYPLSLPRTVKSWERILQLEQGLNLQDGVQLLRSSDPDNLASLRDADNATLEALVRKTHGLPRALEAVVGMLLESPLMTPDDLLTDDRTLSDELGDLFVQGAINTLSDEAVQVLELAALFDRAVPLKIFQMFAQPRLNSSLKPILNRLVRAYFLSYNTENQTLAMHPIDRDYCYQRLQTRRGQDIRGLHRDAAALFAAEFEGAEEIHSLNDLTMPLSAVSHTIKAEDFNAAAAQFLQLDQSYLSMWGHYTELADGYAQLIDHITDADLLRQSLIHSGEARRRLGQLNTAIRQLEQAHQLARTAKNPRDMAVALSRLGWAHYDTGQFEQAMQFWQDALGIFREIDDRHGEGDVLGGMGWVSYLIGDYDQALSHISSTLNIFGGIGEQLHRIGMNIGDSGMIHIARGDYDLAITTLQESLDIATVTNATSEQSYKGGYLATAYLLAGRIDEAEAAAQTARTHDILANRHITAALHGITLTRLNRPDDAIAAFEDAVRFADDLLRYEAGLYNARYARALALAGLSLLRGDDINPVLENYGAALAMCSTAGVIQNNRSLLQALAHNHPNAERITSVLAFLKGH